MNKLFFIPLFVVLSSYAMDAPAEVALPEQLQAQAELLEAVACGKDQYVKALIAKGADPTVEISTGFTLLQLAVSNGDYSTAVALAKDEAFVNACAEDGFTALHDAVLAKNTGLITFLLFYGADVNAKVYDGATALHMAVREGQYLVVVILLGEGAEIDATTDLGETPLFEAVVSQRHNIVTLLIEKGAEVNINACTVARHNKNRPTKIWFTPLHVAAGMGDKNNVLQLLKAGASINDKCSKGLTALDYACKFNRKCVQKLLRARGAKRANELVL